MKPIRLGKAILLALFINLILSGCTLTDLVADGASGGGGLSNEKIVNGLQTALRVGINNAADSVGIDNGYLARKAIVIVLPEDVKAALIYVENFQKIYNQQNFFIKAGFQAFGLEDKLNSIFNSGSELTIALNRTAEKAAKSSVPIFVNAITSMTISDGLNILEGNDSAATLYLKANTLNKLVQTYSPVVDSALETVNAATLWKTFSTNYNSLQSLYTQSEFTSLVKIFYDFDPPPMNTNLGEYTTTKALDGLFYMVGQEEAKIRKDPLARVEEILKEVFGSQD